MASDNTTTTTTTKQEKIGLSAFLDTQRLTRAERSYYLKHYQTDDVKTLNEWLKTVKFTHQ